MFGSIGMPELLIIFVIALIVFGPRKLPELGRSLGKSLGEFKRASNDLRNTLEEEIHVEEQSHTTRESRKPAPKPEGGMPPEDPDSEVARHQGEPTGRARSAEPAASAPAADAGVSPADKNRDETQRLADTGAAPQAAGTSGAA